MHSGGRDDAFRVVKGPFCASESLQGAQLAPTPARSPEHRSSRHLCPFGRLGTILGVPEA